ncbi:glycoside hydrolase family 28 protein [Enterococcus sp. AZ196]|uniref:glycoside hydrolase family 28 protein n=1 Tax=Enterococcus sp. AZ196 TaxID=2774659 RepID=UPI003D2CB0BD
MKVSILEFGASEQKKNNAEAIQAAINKVSKTGGTVSVPAGEYVTGTFQLFSGVTLRVERGAVLKGSTDMMDYPETGLVHNELGMVKALIFSKDADHIAIEGEGIIDFQAAAFFDYSVPNSPDLDISDFNERQLKEFSVKPIDRPNSMIFLTGSTDVSIRDIILLDAACWNVVLNSCDTIKVKNITIRGDQRIPNDDGVHLCSCKNAVISDCDIVSGDDCIAITGINDWTHICENIVVNNCILSSASSGFRIGYWRSKVRNIQINNCTIHNTGRGICFNACNSGYVKDVTINNLMVSTRARAGKWWGRGEALYFNAIAYDLGSQKGHKYDREDIYPNISNITVRGLNAACNVGLAFIGEKKNIQHIRLRDANIAIENTNNRDVFGDVIDLRPNTRQVPMSADSSYWLYVEEVKDLLLQDVDIQNNMHGAVHQVEQKIVASEDVQLSYRM